MAGRAEWVFLSLLDMFVFHPPRLIAKVAFVLFVVHKYICPLRSQLKVMLSADAANDASC